jgi:hypothetical protein
MIGSDQKHNHSSVSARNIRADLSGTMREYRMITIGCSRNYQLLVSSNPSKSMVGATGIEPVTPAV